MSARSPWTAGATVKAGQIVQPRTFVAPDRFDYVADRDGVTGSAEPYWPTTGDGAVTADGSTVWVAREVNVMTWTAVPLYKTAATEPVWPTAPGGTVTDGPITWARKVQNVEDANCPNTAIVIIASDKVYAAAGDVVRYSATDRPLDWSSANDAGFLATGIQMQGSRTCTAMAAYRGRLVPFSASTALVYDLDPDPAKIALTDSFEGLGCQHPRGAVAVGNDLYFPTARGIRTLSVAAASDTLSAGDATASLDPLIVARLAADGYAKAFYYPGAGQYWIVFNGGATISPGGLVNLTPNGIDGALAFVYTLATAAKAGGWSRYTYPFRIDDVALNGDTLAFRSGDDLYEVSEDAPDDAGTPIPGLVQWPHLDFGNLGVTKTMVGLDVVGDGAPSVAIGYDQGNPDAFTEAYPIPADTLTGQLVPFVIGAPSLAVRLTYPAAPWSLQAAALYLQDQRAGA